jgi:aspartate racemase
VADRIPLRAAGVLGGMGPAATIDFMAQVLRLTGAEDEQGNVRLIVDSNPGVPDRHQAINGTGPSPGPTLAGMARGLQAAGADFLVMPCNTAHAFAAEVEAATDLPFLHLIRETVNEIQAVHPHARRIGVLAAAGCLDARLYDIGLAQSGRTAISPDAAQRARLMDLIWRIKRGDAGSEVRTAMAGLAAELVASGAELIVAGCTEVPLALAADDLDVPFINSTEVLARRTVEMAFAEA